MIYQHPLAYLLGLEGLALLRSWAGDYDKAFVEARLAEVRRLLADKGLTNHPGVVVTPSETAAAYDQWSKTYDEPRNNLFDFDEPIMHEILDAQPPGIVLDAACGTGRYAAYLASHGHQVIGVDCSAEMLARARAQVDQARFVLGDLHQLPLRAAAVDVVVCALALAHVPALEPVMAEFARVLRPAGHLVISDVHHELVFRGVGHQGSRAHRPARGCSHISPHPGRLPSRGPSGRLRSAPLRGAAISGRRRVNAVGFRDRHRAMGAVAVDSHGPHSQRGQGRLGKPEDDHLAFSGRRVSSELRPISQSPPARNRRRCGVYRAVRSAEILLPCRPPRPASGPGTGRAPATTTACP